jgi:hypothetical protein
MPGLPAPDARIVDENVEPPMTIDHVLHGRPALILVRYIKDDCADGRPDLGELGDRLLVLVIIAPGDDDSGTALQQAARNTLPDAAVAAGNERYFPLQIETMHATSPAFWIIEV